jgi:hypothetical protein
MKKIENDPCKEFINKEREGFEQRTPRDLWGGIEKVLDKADKPKVKTIELWKVYRAAAVLIMVVGIGFFAMYRHYNPSVELVEENEIPAQTPPVETAYPPEFIEAENYYVAEIDSKLEEVKSLTDNEVVMEELEMLREDFDLLKEEMGDHINDEKILEALIQNYRLRLELLKEILEELQREEPAKNDNYGTELG